MHIYSVCRQIMEPEYMREEEREKRAADLFSFTGGEALGYFSGGPRRPDPGTGGRPDTRAGGLSSAGLREHQGLWLTLLRYHARRALHARVLCDW